MMSKVAINVHVHVSVWTYIFISLGPCLGVELLVNILTLYLTI